MNHFADAVQKILKAPPTRGHFGYRHYVAGLDPEYKGPKYGRSTVADAFFRAGQLNRRATDG